MEGKDSLGPGTRLYSDRYEIVKKVREERAHCSARRAPPLCSSFTIVIRRRRTRKIILLSFLFPFSPLSPAQLNSGATAIVYEARDLHSGLGVALKVLYRAIPDSHALQLLRREANVESLDHPGIVKMLKVFRHGQEKLWCIVSELVDGRDLLDTLNSYPESQLPHELGQEGDASVLHVPRSFL